MSGFYMVIEGEFVEMADCQVHSILQARGVRKWTHPKKEKEEEPAEARKKPKKGQKKATKKRDNIVHEGLDAEICRTALRGNVPSAEIKEHLSSIKELKDVPEGTISSRLHYLVEPHRFLSVIKQGRCNYYTTTKKGIKYAKAN